MLYEVITHLVSGETVKLSSFGTFMVRAKNGRFIKYYSGLVPEEMIESDLKQLTEAQ